VQPLTFVHLSDSHLVTDPDSVGTGFVSALAATEALLREIEAQPAPIEFLLNTGDVNHDPRREDDYRRTLELYSRLDVPVYFLPGNHDRSDWLQRRLLGREVTGPHADQEFEAGGGQFLLQAQVTRFLPEIPFLKLLQRPLTRVINVRTCRKSAYITCYQVCLGQCRARDIQEVGWKVLAAPFEYGGELGKGNGVPSEPPA